MDTVRHQKQALILAAVMLSASLVSACGSVTEKGTETSAAVQTEIVTEVTSEDPIGRAHLPEKDWGGKEFRVLGRENQQWTQFSNMEIYSEGENAEPVNDAVFRRNSLIQDQYNVVIKQILFDGPHKELSKSIVSGEDLYDLAFLELVTAGSPMVEGYFYDMNTVDYIDFTKPWWNPEVNDMLSIENRILMTSSDFSLRDKNRAYVLYYNMNLADQYDIPDLVETVENGKWTIDQMMEYNRLIGNDVNGNGEMDIDDTYGLVMDSYNAFAAFVIASDNPLIGKNEKDQLEIVMNTQHMSDTMDKVIQLACDKSTSFFCEDYQGKMKGDDFWNASSISFDSGRALFTLAFSSSIKVRSSNCEFEYGVVPLPKYDEAQKKYYTMADIYCMLFGIPSSSPTPDFSGFMLEALSAASTDTSLQAYYDVCCKTKYALNENTGKMLDLIFDGIIYDPGIINMPVGLYNILTEIGKKGENNFASMFEQKEKSAEKYLDKLAEAVASLE